MKYAQLIIGLLVGTALGGSVVASTGAAPAGGVSDPEAIKAIVRDVISQEPKLILDSVQKFQNEAQQKAQENANAVLKESGVRDQVFNNADAAFVGPKDAKKIVVEFFDYDCPACKMMFNSIDGVVAKDKDTKIVFREYPIFGEVSEFNSRIGIAVWRLYPEKYYEFHKKMMGGTGHSAKKEKTLALLKELGMNPDKVKAESEKKEVADILEADRSLGSKLKIQGTPTLVIGDEIIPHALSPEDLEQRLGALDSKPTADAGEAKQDNQSEGEKH